MARLSLLQSSHTTLVARVDVERGLLDSDLGAAKLGKQVESAQSVQTRIDGLARRTTCIGNDADGTERAPWPRGSGGRCQHDKKDEASHARRPRYRVIPSGGPTSPAARQMRWPFGKDSTTDDT